MSAGDDILERDYRTSKAMVEAAAKVEAGLARAEFLDAEILRLNAEATAETVWEREDVDRLDGLEQFGDDPGPEEEY